MYLAPSWRLQFGLVIILLLLIELDRDYCEGLQLDDFIRHYEPLAYDRLEIHQSHSRVRRWLMEEGRNGENNRNPTQEPMISLQFIAHQQFFKLRLRRDTKIFGEHFEFSQGTNEPERFTENSHLFEGHLEDVPGSKVYGSIQNGVFDGKIVTPKETFYVEKFNKFSILKFSNDTSTHSVIYSERDIQDALISDNLKGGGGSKLCGANEETLRWMRKVQNSQIQDSRENSIQRRQDHLDLTFSNVHPNNSINFRDVDELHSTTYSLAREFSRKKRQVQTPNSRTTCTLHIRTDPMLWRFIAQQEGKSDKASISEEILSLIGHHVKAANEIFENTLFEGQINHKHIQFVVRRVKIDTDEECVPDYVGPRNPFCAENIDVSNFLDIHARSNYEDFCLSYTFTYRDFTGGVVGLAWVASPEISGAAGGICEKYTGYSGFSSKRSLNTGIVTFLNYNRRLPPKISQLTFTHELGHNFGSPHDSDGECQPGGKSGNYLMYSSATNGYLENNDKFSRCSVTNIASVLDKIVLGTGNLKNCLEETTTTFCGNQIVEKGEECDCGYNSAECTDRCCIPRRTNDGELGKKNDRACKRARGVDCSPSEGPCCEVDCNFSPRSSHQLKLCQVETECTESAYCSGQSPICPNPVPKVDNETLCNGGTQVCIAGDCRGSICVKYGFDECYLSSMDHSNRSVLCNLACLNNEGKCVDMSELNLPNFNGVLQLRPGTPCDNFRGYCDVFQKCRAVDEKGPLLRLTKILLNEKTYKNVIEWVKGNQWWAGLIGLGFIILMALFIKCCAVHTPSSNPYLPQHLKFTETLTRPINTLKRRRKDGAGGQGQGQRGGPPPLEYEMGQLPVRGRRKPGHRPLPSERASMAPYH